jgi:hypothetical protein
MRPRLIRKRPDRAPGIDPLGTRGRRRACNLIFGRGLGRRRNERGRLVDSRPGRPEKPGISTGPSPRRQREPAILSPGALPTNSPQ